MDPLEGADHGLVCPCGYENFERVIVRRNPAAPIVTDFVACIGCRAMYFAPVAPLPKLLSEPTLRDGPDLRPKGPGAIGGPTPPGVVAPPFYIGRETSSAKPERDPGLMEAVRRANKSKHKGRR